MPLIETRIYPYKGWEDDVKLLAEETDKVYEGTDLATNLGMPEARAAQRLLGALRLGSHL